MFYTLMSHTLMLYMLSKLLLTHTFAEAVYAGSGLRPWEALVMIAEKRNLFFSFLSVYAVQAHTHTQTA